MRSPHSLLALIAFLTAPMSSSVAAQMDVPDLLAVEVDGDRLLKIDPETAVPGDTLPLASPNIGGLAADPFSRLLFAVDALTGQLLTIDPESGAVDVRGDTGIQFPQSVAVCPQTGRIYTLGVFSLRLHELDRETGAATRIEEISLSRVSAMEFDPTTGDLYAVAAVGPTLGRLVRIDVAAKTKVDVGDLATGPFITGLAFDAEGQLFGIENGAGSGLANALYRIDKTNAAAALVGSTGLIGNVLALAFDDDNEVGRSFCLTEPNSSGVPSETRGFGSSIVTDQDLVLGTVDLPPFVVGAYLASRTNGFVASPAGSVGNLCLAGDIGRFLGPGEVQFSGSTGRFELRVDLAAIPQSGSSEPAIAGETWFFQAWHRDALAGAATSNFSNGLQVLMR